MSSLWGVGYFFASLDVGEAEVCVRGGGGGDDE